MKIPTTSAAARRKLFIEFTLLLETVLAVLFLASAPAAAWAQAAAVTHDAPPEIAPDVVHAHTYPSSAVTFPNGVTGVPGVVYWVPLGYRPLTLDLYLPAESPPPDGYPLIVHIHGSGWMSGDPRHSGPFADFPGVLASLARWGYVVASVEYRLTGEAEFPAQAQDIKAAIRWLRRNAEEYGIDPARVMTWGESAGGHLAALTALSCGSQALSPIGVRVAPGSPEIGGAEISDCVQGGVAWFGVYNLSSIAGQAREAGALSRDVPDAPEWRLLRCFANQCLPGEIAAASPVAHVDPSDPPLLLITGTEDTTVPSEQTLEMIAFLAAANVPHELVLLTGVGHSFIGETHEKTRETNLRALARTIDFIERTMGKEPRTQPSATPSPGQP